VIGGVAVFIVITYIIRLFMLQLMSDEYKKNADSNAFLKKIDKKEGRAYNMQKKKTKNVKRGEEVMFDPKTHR
jgi:hypothetical protein